MVQAGTSSGWDVLLFAPVRGDVSALPAFLCLAFVASSLDVSAADLVC